MSEPEDPRADRNPPHPAPPESSPRSPIERIISGGQTGADRGALLAAIDLGIPIGGWMPRGARAEDGRIPGHIAQFLRETASSGYEARTGMNVRDADGTLILSLGETLQKGSLRTQRIASDMGRPCLHLVLRSAPTDPDQPPSMSQDSVERWIRWIHEHPIRILNVAGPRESREPGLQKITRTTVPILLRATARPATEVDR